MSSAIPPTPLFPRFAADNSLLLSTEPDFDASFDNISIDLPTPKSLYSSSRAPSIPSSNRLERLHNSREPSRDDLYARRVSDARRRSLSRPSSPFLFSPNLASSSRLMADTSVESDGEVSRVHLAWKSKPPGKRGNNGEISYADVQPTSRPMLHQIPQRRGTALSRYLAKSAINRPTAPIPPPAVPISDDEPLEFARFASPTQIASDVFPVDGISSGLPEVLEGEIEPIFGIADSPEVQTADYACSLPDPPSLVCADTTLPMSETLSSAAVAMPDHVNDDAPLISSRPTSIATEEASHFPVTSASAIPPTPGIPFPTLADVSDTDGETSMTSQSGSRRKSRSEGLVSFFTDFLRGSTSIKTAETVKDVPGISPEFRPNSALISAEPSAADSVRPVTALKSPVIVNPRPRNPPHFTSLTRPAKQRPPLQSTSIHTQTSNSKVVEPNLFAKKPPVSRPRPATNSALANAALAKLPPPGKGSTRASNPIKIRTPERARDLASRRKVFEAKAKTPPKPIVRPIAARTIPLAGRTPGKASRMRAAQRGTFDQAVRERNEQRDRERRDLQRKREEEEEEEYQRRRKETVIRAHPVPDMYKRIPPVSK